MKIGFHKEFPKPIETLVELQGDKVLNQFYLMQSNLKKTQEKEDFRWKHVIEKFQELKNEEYRTRSEFKRIEDGVSGVELKLFKEMRFLDENIRKYKSTTLIQFLFNLAAISIVFLTLLLK